MRERGAGEKPGAESEEFGEVEQNFNLRKAAQREKLFSPLDSLLSLPVPAAPPTHTHTPTSPQDKHQPTNELIWSGDGAYIYACVRVAGWRVLSC